MAKVNVPYSEIVGPEFLNVMLENRTTMYHIIQVNEQMGVMPVRCLEFRNLHLIKQPDQHSANPVPLD